MKKIACDYCLTNKKKIITNATRWIKTFGAILAANKKIQINRWHQLWGRNKNKTLTRKIMKKTVRSRNKEKEEIQNTGAEGGGMLLG